MLNRTELKILIYNKMKKGLSYDQAYKEVGAELKQINKTERKARKDKPKKDFKESFKELTKK